MSGLLAIASMTAAVSGSSWNVASQLSVTMPATGGTAFHVTGTSTFAIDSDLIAAASGGVFSAHPHDGESGGARDRDGEGNGEP